MTVTDVGGKSVSMTNATFTVDPSAEASRAAATAAVFGVAAPPVVLGTAVGTSNPLGGGTAFTTKNSPSVPAAVSNAANENGSAAALGPAAAVTTASPAATAPSLGAASTSAIDAALRALLLDDSTAAGKLHPLFDS